MVENDFCFFEYAQRGLIYNASLSICFRVQLAVFNKLINKSSQKRKFHIEIKLFVS